MSDSSDDKQKWMPLIIVVAAIWILADIVWNSFGPSPFRFDFLVDSASSQGTVLFKINGIQKIIKIDDFDGKFHRNELNVDRLSLAVRQAPTSNPHNQPPLVPFNISCVNVN